MREKDSVGWSASLLFFYANISFPCQTYALEIIYKYMKIEPNTRNKTETKIILLYLFKSWFGKNRKIQITAYSIDIKHFILYLFAFAFNPIFED